MLVHDYCQVLWQNSLHGGQGLLIVFLFYSIDPTMAYILLNHQRNLSTRMLNLDQIYISSSIFIGNNLSYYKLLTLLVSGGHWKVAHT